MYNRMHCQVGDCEQQRGDRVRHTRRRRRLHARLEKPAADRDRAVHAYVPMTNRVHLLITAARADGPAWGRLTNYPLYLGLGIDPETRRAVYRARFRSALTSGRPPRIEPPVNIGVERLAQEQRISASRAHASHDAINDEKRGLIYSTLARLQRATLLVEGKTGKRRVIKYFLSPLLQYGNESLRER